MNKKGNYFIAVYDKDDNNVMEFESIKQCAEYFKVPDKRIRDYIYALKRIKNEFLLYKIDNCDTVNLSKNLQERTR